MAVIKAILESPTGEKTAVLGLTREVVDALLSGRAQMLDIGEMQDGEGLAGVKTLILAYGPTDGDLMDGLAPLLGGKEPT